MTEPAPVLQSAVPILQTGNLAASVAFFERIGLVSRYNDGRYAIVARDAIELHFGLMEGLDRLENNWECRINVTGIRAFYEQCIAAGAVHPNGVLELKPWGFWEFALLDPGGICVHVAERAAS